MHILVLISLNLILITMVMTDFRARYVTIMQISTLFLLTILYQLCISGIQIMFLIFLINCLYSLLLIVSTAVFYKLRWNDLPFVNHQIGWGDILFLLAICPLFLPETFMLLVVGSLFFSMAGHAVFSFFVSNSKRGIPLVGWQSIFILILLDFNYLISESMDIYQFPFF